MLSNSKLDIKKLRGGIIDPITIIGGLFLITTLVVGILVVKNNDSSLNINEQAGSCMTTCMREVGDTDECSYSCGVNKPAVQITAKTPKPEPEKIDNNLEAEEVGNIQEVITAPVVINGSVVSPVNNTTPANNAADISQEPEKPKVDGPLRECDVNGVKYPIDAVVVGGTNGQSGGYAKCTSNGWTSDCDDSEGSVRLCRITDLTNVPTYLVETYQQAVNQQSAQQNAFAFNQLEDDESQHIQEVNDAETKSQAAVVVTNPGDINIDSNEIYYQMYGNNPNQVADSIIQNAGQNLLNSFLNNLPGLNIGINNSINIQMFTDIFQNVASNNSSTSSYNPCPAGSKWIDNTCVINPENIASAENLIANLNEQKQQNTQPSQPIKTNCYLPGLSEEQREACTDIARVATYNTPIIREYIQAYAPQNVTYNYEALGYKSQNECLNDVRNMGRGQSECYGYQPTTDQVTSSIRLGGTATAIGGLAAASGGTAIGYMTLPEMVAAGMATSTVYQTTSATATCIDNPGSKECINEAAWAAVSIANIGTSAWASTLSTGTAETVNAVVNFLNIGADAVDISQSCYGENSSAFGCTAAWVGTVFDAGQGVGDITRVVNNSLSGLDFSVNNLENTIIPHPSNLSSNNIQASSVDAGVTLDIDEAITSGPYFQAIVGDLPRQDLEDMLALNGSTVPENTMPAFPSGLLNETQLNLTKQVEAPLLQIRNESRPADVPEPYFSNGITVMSPIREAPGLEIPSAATSLEPIRVAANQIIATVSPPTSTLHMTADAGSIIGRPDGANINVPLFDVGVSRNAIEVGKPSGSTNVVIRNNGANTIKVGLWPVNPTKTRQIRIGDTITLTPNTKIVVKTLDPFTGDIIIRENQSPLDRLFRGVDTTVPANKVGSSDKPIFFHPDDKVTTAFKTEPKLTDDGRQLPSLSDEPPIIRSLPPKSIRILEDGSIKLKQVYIQITQDGQSTVLPFNDLNIFPHNSRSYYIEFGTLDNNGEFRILENIFSDSGVGPSADDHGLINRLEMNMSGVIDRTITHTEPPLINQIIDDLKQRLSEIMLGFPEDILNTNNVNNSIPNQSGDIEKIDLNPNWFQQNIYSPTEGLLPTLKNWWDENNPFIGGSPSGDLIARNSISPSERISTYVDNNLKKPVVLVDNSVPSNLKQIYEAEARSIVENAKNGASSQELMDKVNRLIDQMVANGINEYNAITFVSSKIVPPYPTNADELKLLVSANQAQEFKDALVCDFSICRHNKNIVGVILTNRGYKVNYQASFSYEDHTGHIVNVLVSPDSPSGMIFLDSTNGRVFYDPQTAANMFTTDDKSLTKAVIIGYSPTNAGPVIDEFDLISNGLVTSGVTSSGVNYSADPIQKLWNDTNFILQENVAKPISNILFGNYSNSFITVDIDGKTPKRVTDLVPSDITTEYQSWLKKLEYNVKYRTGDEGDKAVVSFTGFEYKNEPNSPDSTVEIVPVITGESIGSGASKNAILVTDHVNNKSWVMYGPTTYGQHAEAVGSITMVESIDEDLIIPVKGVSPGANRYLPLVNRVTLFPNLPDTTVVNKTINTINIMASVVYPDGLANIYKFFYIENLKASGLFNNAELHGGNISYAVWDNKPQSGFVMPLPNFKWALIGNVKIPVPGISWITLEMIEASYR